jgi:cell division protein FtsB
MIFFKGKKRSASDQNDPAKRRKKRLRIGIHPLVALMLILVLIAGVIVYFFQNKDYRRTAAQVRILEAEYQSLYEKNEKLRNQLSVVKAEDKPAEPVDPDEPLPEGAADVTVEIGIADQRAVDEAVRAQFIEEIARDRLGMVRPGEVVFEEAERR